MAGFTEHRTPEEKLESLFARIRENIQLRMEYKAKVREKQLQQEIDYYQDVSLFFGAWKGFNPKHNIKLHLIETT